MSPDFDFSISIKVSSVGAHSFIDLAPMLDELNNLWVDVGIDRTSFAPPEAGPEVALVDFAIGTVSGLAASAAWHVFLTKITGQRGDKFRRQLVSIIMKGKSSYPSSKPALSFTCGSVRFFIVEELEESELGIALERALEPSIGEERFTQEIPPGDPPNEYRWDRVTGLWLPSKFNRELG